MKNTVTSNAVKVGIAEAVAKYLSEAIWFIDESAAEQAGAVAAIAVDKFLSEARPDTAPEEVQEHEDKAYIRSVHVEPPDVLTTYDPGTGEYNTYDVGPQAVAVLRALDKLVGNTGESAEAGRLKQLANLKDWHYRRGIKTLIDLDIVSFVGKAPHRKYSLAYNVKVAR